LKNNAQLQQENTLKTGKKCVWLKFIIAMRKFVKRGKGFGLRQVYTGRLWNKKTI